MTQVNLEHAFPNQRLCPGQVFPYLYSINHNYLYTIGRHIYIYGYITTFPIVKSTSVIIGQTMYCNDLFQNQTILHDMSTLL